MSTEQHAPNAALPQAAEPATRDTDTRPRPGVAPPAKRTFMLGGLASAALAACGGGESDTPAPPAGIGPTPTPTASPTPGATPSPTPTATPSPTPTATPSATPSPSPSPSPTGSKPTAAEAARFLGQATFGAKMSDITALTGSTFDAWFEAQTAVAQTLHTPVIDQALANLGGDETAQLGPLPMTYSLWRTFATGPDQLRQRMAYALSQIFVISFESNIRNFPSGPPSYMDMLGANAFGNFRKLLEDVSLHPMMGLYLSHRGNMKEDPATGRLPDENYAREVMQLFSVGLYQLNLDGTLKLDGNGKPIETYTNADIAGLAKVFTGFSWAGPDKSAQRFRSYPAQKRDPAAQRTPMEVYPQFHSISEKKFLGVTIPASSTPDGMGDLKIALDTLFNHPNVGPFIGKQLIQRFVSSNPSTAYVARVATVFNNNGKGVRGDLKAVLKAVLLDTEARSAAERTTRSGKLREPAVRLLNWMRSFNASSSSGFRLGPTENPANELAQSPMWSPSVFNFYRPGYVPPNTKSGAQSLVVPEAQITTETSVAGYLNFMRGVLTSGVGVADVAGGPRSIQADYSGELAVADNPDALADRINLILTGNSLSNSARTLIRDSVATIPATDDAGKLNRVRLAIFMTMAAPDYLVQN